MTLRLLQQFSNNCAFCNEYILEDCTFGFCFNFCTMEIPPQFTTTSYDKEKPITRGRGCYLKFPFRYQNYCSKIFHSFITASVYLSSSHFFSVSVSSPPLPHLCHYLLSPFFFSGCVYRGKPTGKLLLHKELQRPQHNIVMFTVREFLALTCLCHI